MKKTSSVAFLLIFCYFSCFSAPPQKSSLIVVQLDPQSSINHLQHVVRYHFIDGKNISKDTIISVPTTKKDVKGSYIRFDLGTNRLYRDRYIVTGIGNIIDTKNKKVLLEQKDKFIKFSGDSVIFYTNDIFKGKYYSVYDLKKETYTKVEDIVFKAITGQNIEVDYSAKPYKIWLYDINDKKELLVENAGDIDMKSKNQAVPYFWLNENSFLYARSSTTDNKTSIYKVNVDKTSELIGQTELITSAIFYTDEEGNILFSSSKEKYRVDIDKKNVLKITQLPVGHKFYIELDENPRTGRKIKDDTKEIGNYFCTMGNVKTDEKMLALCYEMIVVDERYPQGIMLWNRTLNTWTKLDISDISSVIGWIREE